MLREIKTRTYHYFVDEQQLWQGEYTQWHDDGKIMISCFFINGSYHGEYKSWWFNGQLNEHYFYNNGYRHGEYKMFNVSGDLTRHHFFVDDKKVAFKKLPYPVTNEERLYFTLKHNIPLLPMESKC